MTFGHSYGPDEPDDDGAEEEEYKIVEYPPDHPLSTKTCDHDNCKKDSPGRQQRLCDECMPIMLSDYPDECPCCGATIRS